MKNTFRKETMSSNVPYKREDVLKEWYDLAAETLPRSYYEKRISDEEQALEIYSLERSTHYNERFFFVVDLKEMKITHQAGIDKWLGYSKGEFDFYKYFKIMHPAHVWANTIVSKQLLGQLMKGEYAVEFMKHRFVSEIALKHKNGEYKLYKRTAGIFQLDKHSHQLLEYINEFTFLRDFSPEDYYSTRPASDGGFDKEIFNKEIKKVQEMFAGSKFFSPQQLRILREYIYNADASLENVARAAGVEKSSISKQQRRILEKAREKVFPGMNFDDTRQVALQLKKAYLL